MNIYGLDISLSCTGLAIFDTDKMKPVFVSSYPTNSSEPHGSSLHRLRSAIIKDGKPFIPGEVVKEGAFNKFHKASEVLWKAHGVCEELFFAYPLYEYMPTTIKLVVAGYGSATKEEVRDAILAKYPDLKFRNLDESDATAVVICHMVKKYKMPWNAPFKKDKKTKSKTIKNPVSTTKKKTAKKTTKK